MSLIHEAAAELRTKYDELVQSFQNEGLSEIEAKKEAFSEILPALRNFTNTLERNKEMFICIAFNGYDVYSNILTCVIFSM